MKKLLLSRTIGPHSWVVISNYDRSCLLAVFFWTYIRCCSFLLPGLCTPLVPAVGGRIVSYPSADYFNCDNELVSTNLFLVGRASILLKQYK